MTDGSTKSPPGDADEDRATDLLNRLTRTQADLANLKRRSTQEIADSARFANQAFARDLLSALDHLDRALAGVPPELSGFAFIEGLAMTRQHFHALLASYEVKPIDAVGQPFDPLRHQAVDTDGSEGASTVVTVYQLGYTMLNRVVRPALVRVGTPETEEKSADDGDVIDGVVADADPGESPDSG